LKILAGLNKASSGRLDSDITKKIYIPSQPSSFPWLNVTNNIKFNSKKNDEHIQEIINLVGLHGYEEHFPHNKSKGFRFRMSLGRAISNDPELLLIDEPFSGLNTETRKDIYTLLRSVFLKKSIHILLGTTNITEAIYFSNRIYIMKKNPGEIIDEIIVDLQPDRKLEIIESKDFISIRNKIENIFKERADRQLYYFSI